ADRTLSTYMGTLLPRCGNVSYSGAGTLSPLANDPNFRVIGSGVPIFLAGAEGMVVGEGTQHSSGGGFGTLMVTGDMKRMRQEFLRAAVMPGYGVTIYVGVGVPIPVLDTGIVRSTAVRDEDILTDVIDYGTPRRDRPSMAKVSYADLRSGSIDIGGEAVRTSSLSSYRRAREVARELKTWVEQGKMELTLPVRRLDPAKRAKPMRETAITPRVRDIMNRQVISITEDEDIRAAAKRLLRGETNHLPVLNDDGVLVGIITTYDVSKAVVTDGRLRQVKDIMTRQVIKTTPDEPVDIAARKLEQNNISALPVVDATNRVVGILSAIDLGKLFGGRRRR
ncbi:MAG TPA: homocysteine biosynthesis protein, partial [Methanoculleus sp.]|nr:homocysteine biosynthesis protein [Methanoculleus sp.]